MVADSWFRSVAAGVDAETSRPPITLERDLLTEYRAEHPLAKVFPLIYDVLGQAAEDCDSVMAVTDERGQLLWVRGKPWLLRQAESIRFVEGAQWDERHAGTNAPGTADHRDGQGGGPDGRSRAGQRRRGGGGQVPRAGPDRFARPRAPAG
jgi:transcriptional regulator of acetoin/glycerol metabolism